MSPLAAFAAKRAAASTAPTTSARDPCLVDGMPVEAVVVGSDDRGGQPNGRPSTGLAFLVGRDVKTTDLLTGAANGLDLKLWTFPTAMDPNGLQNFVAVQPCHRQGSQW